MLNYFFILSENRWFFWRLSKNTLKTGGIFSDFFITSLSAFSLPYCALPIHFVTTYFLPSLSFSSLCLSFSSSLSSSLLLSPLLSFPYSCTTSSSPPIFICLSPFHAFFLPSHHSFLLEYSFLFLI
jgi:hypothetical protein